MNTIDPTDSPDFSAAAPLALQPGRPSAWRHLVNQASKLALATIGILIALGFAYYLFLDHGANASNSKGAGPQAANAGRTDNGTGAVLADAGGHDTTRDHAAVTGDTVDSSFRRLQGQSEQPARKDDSAQAALGAAGAGTGRSAPRADDIPQRFDVDNTRKTTADRTRTDVPLEDPGMLLDQGATTGGSRTQPAEAARTGRPGPEMARPVDASGRPIDTTGRPAGTGAGSPSGAATAVAASVGGTDYVIKEGDTFVNIARQLYGKATMWTDIAQANPSIDPNRLKVGQVIHLPRAAGAATTSRAGAATGTSIVGTATTTGRPGRGSAAGASSTPAPSPAQPPAANTAKTYVVQDGDTLWRIAEKEYGDGGKLELIVSANHLADANALKVGDKLVIPAAR